jgi:hypothetical protein
MSDRIAATLTPAQRTAVLDAVATIRTNLPFLQSLSPEERQELFKTGDKSLAFVLLARDAARQFPGVLPTDFDLAAFQQDVDLYQSLSEPLLALRDVLEQVEDTRMIAGVDAMYAALEVYYYVRGRDGTSALNEAAQALGRRFQRRARTAPPAPPA